MESLGVYYNKVLLIGDYLDGGLTKAGVAMRIRNPKGGMYNSKIHMDPRLPMKTRIKKGILYCCYADIARVPFWAALKDSNYKLLAACCYPIGFLLSRYWQRKYK